MFKPRSRAFVYLLAGLAALPAMSIDIGLPALPTISGALEASPDQTQLVISSFLVGLASSQAIIGPLSDRYGRRMVIIGGLAIFVGGGVGCTLSRSIGELAAFRFAQGFGVAAGVVLTRAIVRDVFSDKRGAAKALSTILAVVGMAPMLAPILGARLQLAAAGNWRIVFGSLAALGSVFVALVLLFLDETLARREIDALQPRQLARNYSRFFGKRVCIGNAAITAFLYGGMLAYLSGSPFVFIEGAGLSETSFGLLLAASALGLMGGALLNQMLVHRGHRPDRLLDHGLLILLSASFAIALGAFFRFEPLVGLAIPVCVYVFSFGLIAPNATAAAMEPLPDMAGACASIILSLQAMVGAAAGYVVNVVQDTTPLSTGAVVSLCGVAAFATRYSMARRKPVIFVAPSS
jgi:MFS transporter, DHA1 family, multidrug resistance protein